MLAHVIVGRHQVHYVRFWRHNEKKTVEGDALLSFGHSFLPSCEPTPAASNS
jgi:hypothetical protein